MRVNLIGLLKIVALHVDIASRTTTHKNWVLLSANIDADAVRSNSALVRPEDLVVVKVHDHGSSSVRLEVATHPSTALEVVG